MRNTLLTKIKTAISLGLNNVIWVLIYRMKSRSGYYQKRLPQKQLTSSSSFFYLPENNEPFPVSLITRNKRLEQANLIQKGKLTFFSHAIKNIGSPPDWFINPFTQQCHNAPSVYWASEKAMDDSIDDIKIIWEMARMDWALTLSQAFCLSGESHFIDTLNHWISDWINNNPPQTGPNWICGQEASIRLIHVIISACLLNQKNPLPSLVDFIVVHCERILLTHHYAKAQQNNHATSEAAGLFIGGSWLVNFSQDTDKQQMGRRWQKKGRLFLEESVQKLITSDGSFSQHSLNYHRVLISTLNNVEYFRNKFHQQPFSDHFYQKASLAVLWLFQMVDPETGNGPNLGANDGARLYVLSETSYSDFRPDIQLGACLFLKKRLYKNGPWNDPMIWLGIDMTHYPFDPVQRNSLDMKEGGYATFSFDAHAPKRTWAMIRFPNRRFRPHHADALHFDFWVNGTNILCDNGSFSYAQNEPLSSHFKSSSAHNTVTFDNHDQMPVLNRFLFGQWIKTSIIDPFAIDSNGLISWCGAYQDYKGCRHQRRILTDGSKWHVIDNISGFQKKAIIRWHLNNGKWILTNNCLENEHIVIKLSANVNIDMRIVNGLTSLFYMKIESIPVLEIRVTESPACIKHEIIMNKGVQHKNLHLI